MNSYDVLGVSRTSSDKEIETSYLDLKRKYDPSFNTSVYAYKKYREVIKAYEDIKNEQRRKMYDLKEDDTLEIIEDNKYNLYDYNCVVIKDTSIDYNLVEDTKETYLEDIVINKDISYLYYLLNLSDSITYKRKVKCHKCNKLSECKVCKGDKVVEHEGHLVWCKECFGTGKVSEECDYCLGQGYVLEEHSLSYIVDSESKDFKNEGDVYDDFKSNLILHFNFYDKDSIRINDNVIEINYKLSKKETIKGVNKVYGNDEGAFNLVVPPFVCDNYEINVDFNEYKLKFIFTNEAYNGKDITYYLLFNKKYLNHYIYFNSNYSGYSFYKDDEYFNEYVINTSFSVKGFGEKGKYNGSDGFLNVKVILSDVKDIVYTRDVEIIESSKLFNLFGGNNVVYNYGFKGRNSVVYKDNKYYLFTGDSNKKLKLKDYFLVKCMMALLWLLIPLIMVFIPYSAGMFIVLISVLAGYFILCNFLMEVRV